LDFFVDPRVEQANVYSDEASHREWFGRSAWAVAVIAAGLNALGTGFVLHRTTKGVRS
jgi:hypothetical protein